MGVENQFLSSEEQSRRQQAAGLALVLSIVLMLVKFWAHNLTRSQAIYSDALESVVNVMTGIMALWVIVYSAKPADQDHPYGHGKVEYFSAAFEGGLISAASMVIIFEAIHSALQGQAIQRLNEGILLVAGAGFVNLVLGIFLIRRGSSVGSIALRASGKHLISDFWTSAVVVVGLGLVLWTGVFWLDSALALAVGLWLGISGLKIVRESIAGLMDKEDPAILATLVDVFKQSIKPGFIQIHHVKVIRSGWYHHIDAHVVVPEFWDVKRVHEQINSFEKSVIKKYEFGGEMNFHTDPCRRAYCRVCDLDSCPIRQEPFQEKMEINLEHLRSPIEPPEFLRRRKS